MRFHPVHRPERIAGGPEVRGERYGFGQFHAGALFRSAETSGGVPHQIGYQYNIRRGVRPDCREQYAAAVELYRTTDMSVKAVAEQCKVSEGGFLQHLRFYHQPLLKEKKETRRQAKLAGKKKRGALLGNGRKYEPLPATVQKYAEALAMFRDTALTMKEIVRRTGVPAEGFRFYLHKWHRALVLERSGIVAAEDAELNIARSRQRMKTVAAKYAEAIESLRQHPRPVSYVAREFGHHPEVFRLEAERENCIWY